VYLTVKVGSGDFEVALDVLLDRLARRAIAFFELDNQRRFSGGARWTQEGSIQRRLRCRWTRRRLGGVYRTDCTYNHVLVAGMLRILLDGGGRLLGRHFE
jgi:hypothetical protein